MPFTKDKNTLSSLEDWEKFAGPKSAFQWVDGRSAKEAARAWLGGGDADGLPIEVSRLLQSHPRFGSVLRWTAEPEAKLRFDSFSGEPRNSDLAVHAEDAFGPYLIAVEAKADESYGETVAKTLAAAHRRLVENPRSNGVVRVDQLMKRFFGASTEQRPDLLNLRYQLLTACAGAIAEAERKGYWRAIMLIHEFVTSKTTDENHERNAADLSAFVKQVSASSAWMPGTLSGPLRLPDSASRHKVELFVGKVARNLRAVGA